MSTRVKREKNTSENVKQEYVPVIIQEDANTFAAYTLQTFTEDEENGTNAVTLGTISVDDQTGIPITHIIHTEEVEYDSQDGQHYVVEEHVVEEDQEGNQQQQIEYYETQEGEGDSPNNSNCSFDLSTFIQPNDQSKTKTYYCPNCGNCYSAPGSLKLHIRACTRTKEEQPELESNRKCEICNKVFNSSSYLKEHMLRHTGKGPKKCPKCYRKFIDDAKYEAHMKTHNLQEQLGLDSDDGSSGKKKVVKEYVCSFCSKKFTVVFDTRQTKRRYACDECREKFSNEEMLKKHKAAMDEKRDFHCERCGRKFIFEGFLQRHMPTCDGTIKRRRDRV